MLFKAIGGCISGDVISRLWCVGYTDVGLGHRFKGTLHSFLIAVCKNIFAVTFPHQAHTKVYVAVDERIQRSMSAVGPWSVY